MRRIPVVVAFAVLAIAASAPPADAHELDFERWFTGGTLRLELFHTGGPGQEIVALGGIRAEGDWPGSRTRLLDPTGFGTSRVEVTDAETGLPLYSRGFSTLFGEWMTTAEARETARTFPESVRIPEPRGPVEVRIRRRLEDGSWRGVYGGRIDPGARTVDRSPLPALRHWAVGEVGDPSTRVDLVILGDGYTAAGMDGFRDHARAAAEALLAHEPFRSRRDDLAIRVVETPAEVSGVSRPQAGQWRRSPLGTSYDTLGSERYVMATDDRSWREAAATVPYDAVLILVNERQYGGGGIYGLYSTASARSAFAPYLVVHELGHAFASLGDEYFTSSTAYLPGDGPPPEPDSPNVTALPNPEAVKWEELTTAGTPIPTPWEKERFLEIQAEIQAERRELREAGAPEEELEELFRREREIVTAFLAAQEHAGEVGAFEGAGYRADGLYRPEIDCIMFTRDDVGFCAACRRGIERVIDLYAE